MSRLAFLVNRVGFNPGRLASELSRSTKKAHHPWQGTKSVQYKGGTAGFGTKTTGINGKPTDYKARLAWQKDESAEFGTRMVR